MAKGHIDSEVHSSVERKGWLVEVVAFQPEVEEQLETVVWEADCIAVLQAQEHICLMAEGQLEERYMAMLL